MKQSAASAVLNRIPASADVMIWTVMNMRRSAKSMRLIDADLLKENIVKWLKPLNPDESETIKLACVLKSVVEEINEQPTAFDADKVVEQLKTKKTRTAALQKASEYFEGETDAFEVAIKIVKDGES